MEITFSSNPIKDWSSSNEWKSMDSTAKGFFSQLVLIASQNKPVGFLPADDKMWRKWLGLPAKTFDENDYENFQPSSNIENELKKYFDTNKNPSISCAMLDALESIWEQEEISFSSIKKVRMEYDSWVNHLWDTRWKPMLLTAMHIIDVELVDQFPDLNDKIGNYFVPIAYGLSNVNKVVEKTLAETSKKITKRRSKKEALPSIFDIEAYNNIDNNDVSYDGILWLDQTTDPLKDIGKVLKLWLKPISQEKRKTMWDLGISLLSGNVSEEPKARAFISKLVKQHGEEKVSRAISDLARKPIAPIQAFGYLTSIIKSYTEGTEAEQKARQKRAEVSL